MTAARPARPEWNYTLHIGDASASASSHENEGEGDGERGGFVVQAKGRWVWATLAPTLTKRPRRCTPRMASTRTCRVRVRHLMREWLRARATGGSGRLSFECDAWRGGRY